MTRERKELMKQVSHFLILEYTGTQQYIWHHVQLDRFTVWSDGLPLRNQVEENMSPQESWTIIIIAVIH